MEKQIPDIYNLDYFTDISGNSNTYEINISFSNNKISRIMLDTYDITEYYDQGILYFKEILKKVKKYINAEKYNKINNNTSFVIYIRHKLNTHMQFFNTGARASYNIEDKSFINGIYLDEINLLFGKNANTDDYVKLTLIIISNKTNSLYNRKALIMHGEAKNYKKSIELYNKYKSSLIFEIRGTKKYKDSFKFTNKPFNKKIILPITYPDGKGEIECHMFDKSTDTNIVYICYITKLFLPNGEILNIQKNNLDKTKQKKCSCCVNFYNKFDISIESKYKLICEMQLIDFKLDLLEYYISDNLNIRFEPGDLTIFENNMDTNNILIKVIN
jgi:hypothetical protein